MSHIDFDRLALSDAVRERCIEAHHRFGERVDGNRYIPQQPSSSASDWEDEDAWIDKGVGIFVLRNVNGVLARYRVVFDESGHFTIKRLQIRVRDLD
jgi:hypothetical protein